MKFKEKYLVLVRCDSKSARDEICDFLANSPGSHYEWEAFSCRVD